jgi:hypothetical protein
MFAWFGATVLVLRDKMLNEELSMVALHLEAG